MEREYDNIELRSEEVQEILGTPPGWLARWGTLAALVAVVALGWVGFWIELPETIEADIRITSKDPPRRFIASKTTMLKEVLVENEGKVDSGKTMLLFDSKARLGHVLNLEAALLGVKSDTQILDLQLGRDLLLGELLPDYYDFLEKWEQYEMVSSRRLDNYGRRETENRVRELEINIEELHRKKERLERLLDVAKANYEREQDLFKRGALTREDLNPTRMEKERIEREIQDVQSEIRTKSFQIATLRDKARTDSGRAKVLQDQTIAFNLLKDSFAKLKNKVSDWKREYTVEAPISGLVLFGKDNIAPGQFVQRDTILLIIQPVKPAGMVGRIELSAEDAGQVNKGQKVQVKLYDFPFPDYGAAWGYVEGKGRIPSGGRLPVEIRFPGDTLVTTKGGRVQPEGEMRGKATIFLSNRRLIQRLFGVGRQSGPPQS